MKIKSLIFKLLGAFLLVIAVGTLVMSLLISSSTKDAFTLYSTKNSQAIAIRLAPSLTSYYLESNSWDGVDTYLASVSLLNDSNFAPGTVGSDQSVSGPAATPDFSQTPTPQPTLPEIQSTTTGPGQGQGIGQGLGPNPNGGPNGFGDPNSNPPTDMMNALDQRVTLADADDKVIYDSSDQLVGQKLSDTELANGIVIKANDVKVGTLIVSPKNLNTSETRSGEFLTSVNQAVVNSSIIAAVIALIIGTVLFSSITAPLRQLTKAANSIAKGDLSQRVNIHTRDEIGELGTSFNSMAESLSKAEIQRKHWMADVAHELRTPLAAIQATLEGMQDGILPMDREQVDSLYEESTLLNRLIGDLRILSLAEAGQIKLECIPTDIPAFLQKIADHWKVQASQKEVLILIEPAADLPQLCMDSYRMSEVINNLVANALRYTPKQGSIRIAAKKISDPESIEITITDTGSGIDAENLPHVFDRFYRADKSRTRSSGGSGLGLAIVKQLVDAHHGTITADSPAFTSEDQPGYGTRFIIRIPLEGNEPSSPENDH